MSLQRFDPFREALTLRDAMNRLFEDSFVRPSSTQSAQLGTGYGLALDVEESGDNYTVRASLPGFKPEDVQVQVVGDTLSISAQYNSEQESNENNYLLKERRMGSVSRTITLPQRVQSDQAQATFDNGELTLTLPKAEEVRPRQIKIDVQGRQELSGGTAPRTEDTGAQARQSLTSDTATPQMNEQAGDTEQSQEQQ